MNLKLRTKLIDTHCHLDFPEFNPDREAVIRRAKEGGIDYIINIGSSLKSSINSIELAQKYDFIYAAVGIHPHDADNFRNEEENKLRELAKKEKVVAIGEVGLDYYKNYSGVENQKSLFTLLINLSKEFNLPLVIHSRQAEADTLKILRDFMPLKAVVHCFSGSEDFLKACLDLGFLISFTCNITYKKAQNLKDIVKIAPLEKILLETDAPYLAPEGLRGRRNEPLNVKYVAEELSRIKTVGIDEVARITTNSAKDFFRLK
jgi:TatD DNase family protein